MEDFALKGLEHASTLNSQCLTQTCSRCPGALHPLTLLGRHLHPTRFFVWRIDMTSQQEPSSEVDDLSEEP